MGRELKVYLSDSTDPYYNLAFEEILLSTIRENETILYLWQNEKTVVIGRNQNLYLQCDVPYAKEHGIKLARRYSGGGAVYHDLGNLNYSIIQMEDSFSEETNMEHLLDTLRGYGLEAVNDGRNDIVVDQKKVSGMAYYNKYNVCCQHGCILVDTDIEMMEAVLFVGEDKFVGKNIDSVRSRVQNLRDFYEEINVDKLRNDLICSFSEPDMEVNVTGCDEIYEREDIRPLLAKHSSQEWIRGEMLRMDVRLCGRFSWGDCTIAMDIKNGTIVAAAVYSDSLNTKIFMKISACLCGIKLSVPDIISKLNEINENSEIISDIKKLINRELSTDSDGNAA
ncbi:MAG: lipoate--protein ligase [Lachnospiraceae bacterium]|nr:lipoate--protein ligase [Lachnospiraceae bacterium]